MRIRQLQCFVILAEELNFTRAAKRLNMSQPPLSLQIQSLERTIGAALFQRTSRKMTLTSAGEVFLSRARSILAQHDRALLEVQEVLSGQHGTLDIGATGSILRAGLAELLAQFCRQHPLISVRLHEQAPALQVSDLLSGRMDVSFNRSVPFHEDLSCQLAWREELVVLLPSDHRLRAARTLSIDDLRHEQHVILRPDSSDFAAYILSFLTQGGARPRISQRVVDAQSIPSLVSAGFGIGLVPAGIAATAGPLIHRPIAPVPPVSDIFAVYRRGEGTPALAALLATLEHSFSGDC
ncbi:LysR substrate-binding domain-containing protein [Paracoccus benzoatiresistens]|uniref:LysR substrate-binding domain-containing protein n=1 Tax=Paracoccus benzoatiresistens TaxID=2997341 RepID=A0ABT4JAF7_9RHOB|nr:LysR substrate-binding domain-containing protein [Paracoccus sp. EF6]MCZ0964116.1 LysR substrate-binding domain-containing protein [Paracoccus sp. EF6]